MYVNLSVRERVEVPESIKDGPWLLCELPVFVQKIKIHRGESLKI